MDFLSPYLNSAMAGLLAVIFFSYYLVRRSRVGLPKIASMAAGAWPVIGHLPLLRGTKPLHVMLGAMVEKCWVIDQPLIGPISSLAQVKAHEHLKPQASETRPRI